MPIQRDAHYFQEKLRQQLPLLTTRYQVKSLGLFGSYIHQQQQPESDLDLLVEFQETPSLLKFIERERIERVARIYASNQEASQALGIAMQSFGRLCRKTASKPRTRASGDACTSAE